ncbi:hypothetical protein Tco_0749579 [Tanacetum coccineum]|uniref:Uncharacterized protein n=1 Tax=Tanacetum coccineum TaxID=301880 RepID=A0ABQ4YYT8_9ASTR
MKNWLSQSKRLLIQELSKGANYLQAEVRNKHENDRDDEEDCYVKIDEMGKPIYGLNIEKYLNCDDPMDRALALQETLNPFRKKGDGDGKWHAKVRIMEPYGNVFDQGYKTKSTDRKLLKYYKLSDIMSPNRLGGHGHTLTILELACRLGLCTSDEIHDEGFDTYFLGGLRDDDHFNVNQYWSEISSENELILSRSSTRTIRKLVLRVLQKMITYGLCQRTTGYDKVQRNELWLMSMFEAKHQNGYVNVAWLIAKWLKMKGVGSQREGMICCGQFITKIARRANLLTDEVLNGLSAPVYCRSLDTTTLRKLIDSNGRLVAEVPAPGNSRFVVPRPPHHSIFDLYDRMGRMEIRQGDKERMTRWQSYPSDRYVGVFEYMAGHYNMSLQRDYAPPGYDEERDEK